MLKVPLEPSRQNLYLEGTVSLHFRKNCICGRFVDQVETGGRNFQCTSVLCAESVK